MTEQVVIVRLVGINNRNLEDFTVDLETTRRLLAERRERLKSLGITVVSESGLHIPTDLDFVSKSGNCCSSFIVVPL